MLRSISIPIITILLLEKGSDSAGLQHIIKGHEVDFINKGISKEEIPNVIMKALSDNKIVGTSSGAPVYQVVKDGVTHNLTIITGNNGYVVTAYPASKWRPIP